ncbi:MAG: Hint domain-containing protein [Pseudorhodobacter sp.]|nr:Hint domain-containing protein [Pseudorhodobacter sp.]
MADWIALSDRGQPRDGLGAAGGAGALLVSGALVMELALPLAASGVLLDYRATDGWLRALSVYHDPAAGIAILHRQGDRLARHLLPGPLPQVTGTARLILRWNAPGRTWVLRYELPDSGHLLEARGTDPLPLPLADLEALCCGAGVNQRHPAVLWYGATQGESPPERAPWIGLRTPVATPTGYRLADSLRPGDLVLTRDAGVAALQSVRHMDLPSRGHFAPVLLRAPYFAAHTDLLVSADQRVALAGTEVEYLFAEDEVLAKAGDLTDGRSAFFDTRRAVVSCVSLDLGYPDLIISDGCALASARHGVASLRPLVPRRTLHDYEAVPLLALLGRSNGRRAA